MKLKTYGNYITMNSLLIPEPSKVLTEYLKIVYKLCSV